MAEAAFSDAVWIKFVLYRIRLILVLLYKSVTRETLQMLTNELHRYIYKLKQ